jgi:Gluconate 2-dehydrogenase subunit 3
MLSPTGSADRMDRREAIRRLGTLLLGGVTLASIDAVLGARTALAAQPAVDRIAPFTQQDIALLDEVADTILPETGTPGAKAAGVGAFMALMVSDVLSPAQRQVFREGMRALDERCSAQHGKPFLAAAPAQRLTLLQQLDHEQYEHAQTHADDSPAHWFRMMKGLALFGYFTSEIGYTQALRYVETPGRFEPVVPHAPGDRIWAKHASDVGGGRAPGIVNDRRGCRPLRSAACA